MAEEEKKEEKTPPSGSVKPKGEEEKTPPKKGVSRTVPYSRFSEVNTELQTLKTEKDGQETKKLEEQKKFQQLSEKQKEKIITLEKEIKSNKKFAYFSDHAIKANVISVRDAFKLADINQIEIGSDGKVSGVEKVIEDLQKNKPYLFQDKEGSIGSASSPPGGGTGEQRTRDGKRIYREEEFDDKKFYKENEEDIGKAYKEGRVQLRKGPQTIIS